jgi:hypothetical protein
MATRRPAQSDPRVHNCHRAAEAFATTDAPSPRPPPAYFSFSKSANASRVFAPEVGSMKADGATPGDCGS